MMRKAALASVLAFLSVFIIVSAHLVPMQAASASTNKSATPSPINGQPTVSIMSFRVVTPSLASTHVRIGLTALAVVFISFGLWVLFKPSN